MEKMGQIKYVYFHIFFSLLIHNVFRFDYDSVQNPKGEGIKHSALLVCSANYVRSPMMQGVLSKMLTDIGTISYFLIYFCELIAILFNIIGKRSEWALGGAGIKYADKIPFFCTQFILHREGCPVYAHSIYFIFSFLYTHLIFIRRKRKPNDDTNV